MGEQWRVIEEFPDYVVSSRGRVLSRKFDRSRLLKQNQNRYGYPTVRLRCGDSDKTVSVHRLVAQAFIPNPYCLPAVNHLDGDKANNDVGNLEWCTNVDNSRHASRAGLLHTKLSTSDVTEIRILSQILADTTVGELYGVSDVAVRKVCDGRSFSHWPFPKQSTNTFCRECRRLFRNSTPSLSRYCSRSCTSRAQRRRSITALPSGN